MVIIGKREMYTRFRWGNLKERDHLEDPDLHGWVTLKGIVKHGTTGYGLVSSESG
jgi:hypothetical protein